MREAEKVKVEGRQGDTQHVQCALLHRQHPPQDSPSILNIVVGR